MQVDSVEELDNLSDNELWNVAASRRNEPDVRHAAMQRWLFPDMVDDWEANERVRELKRRASRIKDDVPEEQFEYNYHEGIYFDAEGRMVIEHNGVKYLIEPTAEAGSL